MFLLHNYIQLVFNGFLIGLPDTFATPSLKYTDELNSDFVICTLGLPKVFIVAAEFEKVAPSSEIFNRF